MAKVRIFRHHGQSLHSVVISPEEVRQRHMQEANSHMANNPSKRFLTNAEVLGRIQTYSVAYFNRVTVFKALYL